MSAEGPCRGVTRDPFCGDGLATRTKLLNPKNCEFAKSGHVKSGGCVSGCSEREGVHWNLNVSVQWSQTRGVPAGGQLNCAGDSTFFNFPRYVLCGGQTVCFATQLSSRSASNLRVLVAMVQYDMSADCDGQVTRGSLSCLVPELRRVVKRVVPKPSMIRQRIGKTDDLVETRSTPSWRPFGCCLPIKANRVIECWTNIFRTRRSDLEVRHRRGFGFSSAFPAPADQRHVAHVGAGGWKWERAV